MRPRRVGIVLSIFPSFSPRSSPGWIRMTRKVSEGRKGGIKITFIMIHMGSLEAL